VNVAARLCAAARAGEIVMSAAVRDRLGEPLPDLGVGEPLALRGREEPVVVFRLANGN